MTSVELAGNEDYVDISYGFGETMTLDPNHVDSIGGIENTGYAWTGEQLYQIICNYLNI